MRAREAAKLKKGDVIFNRHTNMYVEVLKVELLPDRTEPVYMIHTIERLNRIEEWTHIYFQKLEPEYVQWYKTEGKY